MHGHGTLSRKGKGKATPEINKNKRGCVGSRLTTKQISNPSRITGQCKLSLSPDTHVASHHKMCPGHSTLFVTNFLGLEAMSQPRDKSM
jgi:hypothetical protein